MVEMVGNLKSNRVIRSLFLKPYQLDERPKMEPDTRLKLLELYDPEITRLEKLLDRDLSHWRE